MEQSSQKEQKNDASQFPLSKTLVVLGAAGVMCSLIYIVKRFATPIKDQNTVSNLSVADPVNNANDVTDQGASEQTLSQARVDPIEQYTKDRTYLRAQWYETAIWKKPLDGLKEYMIGKGINTIEKLLNADNENRNFGIKFTTKNGVKWLRISSGVSVRKYYNIKLDLTSQDDSFSLVLYVYIHVYKFDIYAHAYNLRTIYINAIIKCHQIHSYVQK